MGYHSPKSEYFGGEWPYPLMAILVPILRENL